MGNLYNKLIEYRDSDYYGFHMPGHKRNEKMLGNGLPFGIDITEIDGFDDLHHADGILLEAQKQAAELYGAGETHFLINGSTVGLLSAIAGVTRKGDTILVARNCHKSVYHAIYMNELHPVYLYPGFDEEAGLNTEISVQDVEDALMRHPQIRAVVIVSPTYDGVVSEVKAIAEAVHHRGLPLIVDEAHGAHFGFHPYFPENSNQCGADLVIHSLHKTLPSLTQTALLHMNGDIVNRVRVREYLHMLQSSSPSYILMASMDQCVNLLTEQGKELFDSYAGRLKKLRESLQTLRHLKLLETEHYDPSKIVISVKGTDMTSRQLYDRLREESHLQMEMVAGSYVLAMTTICDTPEGMARLAKAITGIDEFCKSRYNEKILSSEGKLPRLETVYSSAELARILETGEVRKRVLWQESVGQISTEYAYLYPPGSPFIVPGERISQEAAEKIESLKERGFSLEGLQSEESIEVMINGQNILYDGEKLIGERYNL